MINRIFAGLNKKNFGITSCFFNLQVVEKKQYDISPDDSILNESFIPYSRQEEYEAAKIRKAIQSTATEKFHTLMTLMKMGEMMKKAKITHTKPV